MIPRLMHHFYLQHPLSHKHFNLSDVECLLFLLELDSSSFLPILKLLVRPLALVTAKFCSDLTLSCIDNQQLFLQHHAAIFVLASDNKMD